MALYGPNSPAGFIPFTGFSPTLGATDAIGPVTAGNVQFDGMTQEDSALSYILRRSKNLPTRKLLLGLIGATAGGTITQTRSRVAATQSTFSATDNGGLITIETVNLINRVSTSADVTNITAMLSRTPVPTYAVDVGGSAGGGKLGF